MSEIRFTDRYDYVLGTLYHLKLKGKTGHFSLKQILETIGFSSEYDEIYEIAKYLEAQGYVNSIEDIGDVQVQITVAGIVAWENKRDRLVVKFEDFVKSKEVDKIITNTAETLTDQEIIRRSRSEVHNAIEKIIQGLERFKEQNPDLLIDAKILKLEMQKIRPDKEILIDKIFRIEQIPLFRQEISLIRKILNIRKSGFSL